MALNRPLALRNPRSILNKGGGYYPPCFKSATQYEQWRYLMRVSQESSRAGFCIDCTPEYKVHMLAQNKCIHPETVFVKRVMPSEPDYAESIGVSSASVFWACVERGVSVIGGNEKD